MTAIALPASNSGGCMGNVCLGSEVVSPNADQQNPNQAGNAQKTPSLS